MHFVNGFRCGICRWVGGEQAGHIRQQEQPVRSHQRCNLAMHHIVNITVEVFVPGTWTLNRCPSGKPCKCYLRAACVVVQVPDMHLGRQCVVVPNAQLLNSDGVIFIDNRHSAVVEELCESVAGIEVLAPVGQVSQ